MDNVARRRFLCVGGLAGTLGFAGCLRTVSDDDSSNTKDTDGDGVINSEDYAPRDPEIQREEQLSDDSTATETVIDESMPEDGSTGVITRRNSDGEVYQSGRVTDGPRTLRTGTKVTVRIEITGQIPDASDNIVYGAVGSPGGTIYGLSRMDTTGTGSVTVRASIPTDASGTVLWTWVPAISTELAQTRAKNSFQSWADERQEPRALPLGRIN